MFAVPDWKAPTVSTAGSAWSTIRLIMVWYPMTAIAPMTTGSLVPLGVEPCPPTPGSSTSICSVPAMRLPSRSATLSAG
ncbi:hypothetical protein D9M68_930440 [compost metagenome]